MTTNNAVNVGLSGSTGTGSFVGSNSPSLTTPAIGTPDSGTLTNCSGLPASAGLSCSSTNDNASAGQLGQFVTNTVAYASAISIPTTGTPVNITSIALTAGDWDVWGNIIFNISVTGTGNIYGWISSSSATQPDLSLLNTNVITAAYTGGIGFSIPSLRFSLSGNATIYLSGEWASFTTHTISGAGGIYARRVR